MKKHIGVLALSLFASSAFATVTWGSFDSSRINYAGGVFSNGTEYDSLRAIVTGGGSTIAAGTSTLTAGYLSGVDVFYTSLLNVSTGTLSGAEQTALQNWVAGGGTLIVTADIFPLPAYESFTSVYGVTGYTSVGGASTGSVVGAHLITSGVSSFSYNTNSTYVYGANAMLLGDDALGNDFMIVMEPATGFNVGGRIVVFGDHNMFTDSMIGMADNTLLAQNLVSWSKTPVPEPATFVVLGLGAAFLRRKKKQ